MKMISKLSALCTVALIGCASTPKIANDAALELSELLDFAPVACPESPDCHCVGAKAKSNLVPLRYTTAQYCPEPLSDKSMQVVTFYSWDDRGNKVDHGQFVDGEMHGPWTSWHSNGKISGQATYDRGLQIGQFTEWHENGQVFIEGQFDQGKEDGQWLIYSEDGKISKRLLWKAGKVISKADG